MGTTALPRRTSCFKLEYQSLGGPTRTDGWTDDDVGRRADQSHLNRRSGSLPRRKFAGSNLVARRGCLNSNNRKNYDFILIYY